MHSFPEIEPMCVFPELVACNFYLRTALFAGDTACLFQHGFSDPLISESRFNRKFHDLGNEFCVVQLLLKPHIQNSDHTTILIIDKTIEMPVDELIPVDFPKSIKRQFSAFHITNQIIYPGTITEGRFSIHSLCPHKSRFSVSAYPRLHLLWQQRIHLCLCCSRR